jgi:dihydroorotate dehydrogenase electron transfer subunit
MAFLIEKPKQLCEDHYLLKIEIDGNISHPGQFANIKIGDTDPLLRRPFSIYDHNGNVIELIIRVVGKATVLLKDITAASYIDVIAPLGHGFSIPADRKTLLIGGGVGNAPLYYLAKELRAGNNQIHYLYAARSKEYIYNKTEYGLLCDEFIIATDNGSEGRKGLAGDIAKDMLRENNYDIVYTCGPEVMMRNIARLLKNNNAQFEVSVENYFGCGIGLC